MPDKKFRVGSIDHVELFVPDQYEAAHWYEDVLGLEIIPEYEFWAKDGGPLMLSSDQGRTKVALFQGEPRGMRKTAGHHRVAFAVSGQAFINFIKRLDSITVYDDNGNQVESWDVADHKKSFSIYFCDPFGNRYEITSYDYDLISNNLENLPLTE
ncbi:VOC family protein [candidate division KSB1 bacterium]|nr:VOC family protein [candidate division KSB1 bacterium]